VRIWSTADGKLISSFYIGDWPDYIVFSSDGSRILTVTQKGPSRLWNVLSGTEIAALRGHKSHTYRGTFSHDGRLVATISIEGTARIWDGVTGDLRSVLGEETGVTFGDGGVAERD